MYGTLFNKRSIENEWIFPCYNIRGSSSWLVSRQGKELLSRAASEERRRRRRRTLKALLALLVAWLWARGAKREAKSREFCR